MDEEHWANEDDTVLVVNIHFWATLIAAIVLASLADGLGSLGVWNINLGLDRLIFIFPVILDLEVEFDEFL